MKRFLMVSMTIFVLVNTKTALAEVPEINTYEAADFAVESGSPSYAEQAVFGNDAIFYTHSTQFPSLNIESYTYWKPDDEGYKDCEKRRGDAVEKAQQEGKKIIYSSHCRFEGGGYNSKLRIDPADGAEAHVEFLVIGGSYGYWQPTENNHAKCQSWLKFAVAKAVELGHPRAAVRKNCESEGGGYYGSVVLNPQQ